MAFCPNCGTQYEQLPLRCTCGYLLAQGTESAEIPGEVPAAGRFEFNGQGLELAILYLKLGVFSIFTLGIYSFWGRTAIRRYLWSHTHFAGRPLDYHGTGREMAIGWLKFVGLIVLLYGGFAVLTVYLGERSGPLPLLFLAIGYSAVMPLALHGAIRYRWSRTSWQGRRFVYAGELFDLARIFWVDGFLTVITLSVYLPFFLANLRRYVVDNTSYGGHTFRFTGEGRDLLWPYVKFLLLFLPTLGIYGFWYRAQQGNYFWSKTSFANVPFASTMTGVELMVLAFTNGLLTYFTLGIGYPWAVCRNVTYILQNRYLTALPNIRLLEQSPGEAGALGDVLGESIGTDAGIDAGFGL